MTHGHHPHTGVEVKSSVSNESAEQFASRMKAIQQRASEVLVKAKDAMKRKYDQHKRESRNYQIGDWVYIDATHLRTDRPTKKFEDKRYGPFQIEKKVGAAAYQLKLPRKWKAIHPVFNEVQLSPANAPIFPNQKRPAVVVPELLDKEKEPEEILDSKVVRGGLQYLVKWQSLPRSENTWEKRASLLPTYKPLIDMFHRNNPTAARVPTILIPPLAQQARSLRNEYGDTYNADSWDYWDRVWTSWKENPTPVQRYLAYYTSRGLDAREGGNVTNHARKSA